MLTGLLVFVATLAFASAQCSFEGTVYQNGNTTVYFGAAVGDWIPAIEYDDESGTGQAYFMTFKQATTTRWELQDWGANGVSAACDNTQIGQYRIQFSSDCSTVTFYGIFDECVDRFEYWGNETVFTQVPTELECPVATGTFKSSAAFPYLSNAAVTPVAAGTTGYYIASVGTLTALFQQYTFDTPSSYQVIDYTSAPYGYSCEERLVGRYTVSTGAEVCQYQICGVSDSCVARAELTHGVAFNGFEGECPSDIEIIQWPNSGCSRGNAWALDPADCTDQFGGDQCIFCHGVANGINVRTCIERNGGTCNDIFRSIPAKGWCNLEFECPASTLSLSVIAVFSVLLASFLF